MPCAQYAATPDSQHMLGLLCVLHIWKLQDPFDIHIPLTVWYKQGSYKVCVQQYGCRTSRNVPLYSK
eukprot:48521-Rhodomonas_salina.1